jgi:hypothetical protein
MEDLLKDRRVVAGIIAVGLIALVALFFLFRGLFVEPQTEFADDSDSSEFAPASAPAAVPGAPSDMPPGVSAAGSPASGGSGKSEEKAQAPVLVSRSDPFASLIPPPKKPSPEELLAMQAQTELASLPPLTIYQPNPTALQEGGTVTGPVLTQQEDVDNTQRRVAGIVMGKNTSAILEIDGGTVVVHPGDVLPDLSRVERIERNRVVLKKGPRSIFVPLESSANGPTGGGVTGGPVGGTAGPYGGGRLPGIPPRRSPG